ncbi:hypothetical protein P3X46_024508 [Hevea brasiliensis]|uniref:WEB family protein n=1 Tax=Hevea brasiliensis TaxID=3981 RepID=A0ABQ9L621_HEVBR|nr:hypothetical protein P3X46_024508 [Hevea brasiliensis]
METPTLFPKPTQDYSSSVDTSRPFRSVEEALAIFGQRILNNNELLDTLKKLKAELEQTKEELKLLKERESETEIAVASLNAEIHKSMLRQRRWQRRMQQLAAARRVSFETEKKENVVREEEKKRELLIRMENLPTLTHILNLSEEKGYFGGKKDKKKKMKKKPIVPLVGDLFFSKKRLSNKTLNNPLFASAHGVF